MVVAASAAHTHEAQHVVRTEETQKKVAKSLFHPEPAESVQSASFSKFLPRCVRRAAWLGKLTLPHRFFLFFFLNVALSSGHAVQAECVFLYHGERYLRLLHLIHANKPCEFIVPAVKTLSSNVPCGQKMTQLALIS